LLCHTDARSRGCTFWKINRCWDLSVSFLVDSVPAFCSFLPHALVGTLALALLLAIWIRWKALWVVAAFGILANAYIEILQAYVLLHPGFDVLYMQPDAILG
jgi:hypothetical protein